METATAHREETLARIQEIALRSAYAHGKMLTDFSFELPRQDDVISLPNGTLAIRGETNDTGYSAEEDVLFHALFPSPSSFSLPSSFEEHQDVIVSSHLADLEEIVRGFIHNRITFSPPTLHAFAAASFCEHEMLLAALHDIFHLDNPEFSTHLMRESYPAFVRALDVLTAASRRFRHNAFTLTLTSGAHNQRRELLVTGLASGYDAHFFATQLALL